jgi:hypothetical protein
VDRPLNLYDNAYGDDVPDYVDITYIIHKDGTTEWFTEYAQTDHGLRSISKHEFDGEVTYGTVIYADNQKKALDEAFDMIMDFIEKENSNKV